MKLALSHESIESFVGNVLPLHLGFDGPRHAELACADITWRVEGDAVSLRGFSGDKPQSFNHGVLLLFQKIGEAVVTATYAGECYTCRVTSRALRTASSDEVLHYYVGDLHDHTNQTHNREKFANRTEGFQIDYINVVKQENLLDFCVISDHASVTNDIDFFRGFTAVEQAQPMELVVLPGAESEIGYVEDDRLGIPHRLSGEVVSVNAGSYVITKDWLSFEEQFVESPAPIGIFAHPLIVGFSTKGLWDFDFRNRTTPTMLRMMRGVELGSGRDQDENLIYEYAYSHALDYGFRVSPTCSSDSHGPEWGYYRFPGKTVLLAKEKSYEAFVDALRQNRFYACETGNVKLRYCVNGQYAPCDLAPAEQYDFTLSLSFFKEEPTTKPVRCQVISDYGKCVLDLDITGRDEVSFSLCSATARYFYLRLSDGMGRRTWSMPVFTGRAYDVYQPTQHTPIDPQGMVATDLLTGKDAFVAIDGDPKNTWFGEHTTASLLVDLGQAREVSAIGFYHRYLERFSKKIVPIWHSSDFTPGFPVDFEVWLSLDGAHFERVVDGRFRNFGSEEVFDFARQNARFLRFDVRSTVGSNSGYEKYKDGTVSIGNLTVFA